MRSFQFTAVFFCTCWCATDAFSTLSSLQDSRETKALYDWLLSEDRCTFGPTKNNPSIELRTSTDSNNNRLVVTTTRPIVPGEILFRLSSNSVFSAAAAYSDKDLGGKLRDISVKAGPGFNIVALAGAIAAERVRGYRVRTFQGLAPESAGILVPSKFGELARWLWASHKKEDEAVLSDPDIEGPVQQGIQLLVPLLDVAARRAWTAVPNSKKDGDPWDEDAASVSWSRSDLEDLARSAFGLVLSRQKSPPSFVREGVGRLVPSPFLDKEKPETWPVCDEAQTLLPLVDALLCGESSEANAVLGSPPYKRGEGDILWCIASRELVAGERVLAIDPWA